MRIAYLLRGVSSLNSRFLGWRCNVRNTRKIRAGPRLRLMGFDVHFHEAKRCMAPDSVLWTDDMILGLWDFIALPKRRQASRRLDLQSRSGRREGEHQRHSIIPAFPA